MSRFVELLKRVTEGYMPPLGFGPANRREKTPALVIVASLRDATAIAKAVEDGAKALLVDAPETDDQLREAAKAAGDVPLGVRVEDQDGERLKALAEAECDFIVVESIASPWDLLKDSGLGKVLQIDPTLPESHLRAISSVPADAFLVTGWDVPSLTIQRQMFFRLIGTRKPVLARLPTGLSPKDIEGLWEVGVAAIVTDELDRLAEFREAIAALPSRRKPRGEKTIPLLPHLAGKVTEVEEQEEEDEDE